jgi:hypothetical protein
VNDTTRELGASLGIALAGSILAVRYGHILTPQLAAFPAPVRGPASGAFLAALQSALLTMAVIIAVRAAHRAVGAWP